MRLLAPLAAVTATIAGIGLVSTVAHAGTPVHPGTRELARQFAYRPYEHPGMVANAAAPVTVNQILNAMDVDPTIVTSPSMSGDTFQYRDFGVFPSLGTMLPTNGANFALLSTGTVGAGTPQTVDPSATNTQPGTDVGVPCANGDGYDCVQLQFSFVVPTGMHSIKFDFNFLSAEFPEFVGTMFNDEFAVAEASPSHNYSNIVFDSQNHPVNINSAFFNEPCTATGASGFNFMGFDGTCDAGATGLLTTAAPVEEGENVTLTFSLHDRGDGIYDSAVMIDNFVLSTESVPAPSTDGQIKIDWVTPKSGPVSGGTQVQIHGVGFVNVSQVAFAGSPALFQALDDTTLVVVTPPGYEGPADIAITGSPNGSPTTGVKPNGFMYYVDQTGGVLSITDVTPPEGPESGSVDISIRGTGFLTTSTVTIGGAAATNVQFIAGDEVIVTTPPGSGSADVRVTNPDGTSATRTAGYLYLGDTGSSHHGASIGGCGCDLAGGSTAPVTPVGSLVVGMAIAAWIVRRRGKFGIRNAAFKLALPAVAVLASGCQNDTTVAQVNDAPVADAGPSQEAFVAAVVQLDGSGSHDFENGGFIQYAWQIMTKPDFSNATLSDPTVVNPTFVADQPGLYRVGLVVTDGRGQTSGDIGYGGSPDDNLMDVVALPFNDLKVTLEWDTDLSDLDLHVVQGSVPGQYFDPYRDCFYGVPTPDWGVYSILSDNPTFNPDVPAHQDADHGFGPEMVSLPSPGDAGTYTIVVHEFNDHGAAPTTPHVVVTLGGTVLADVTASSTMNLTDAAWVVGTVSWPGGTWTAADIMTTHGAIGGPAH